MKKIAVMGTGVVAQVISEKLASLGHEVMMGTRNPADTSSRTQPGQFGRPSFAEWQAQNPSVKLGTYAEAAAFGDMLVNATNGEGTMPALDAAGKDILGNKVLLDIANPLDFSKGFPPSLTVCNTDSLAEQAQRAYPDLRIVKSLNTMNAYVMVNPAAIPGAHSVFVSGNDVEAKTTVKELLGSFGWSGDNIIDLGDISTARGTEMLLPIWVRLYGALKHGMFNFNIVQAPATN